MARYIGEKCKATRRIGTDLYLKRLGGRDIETKCKLSSLPGQHGAKKARASEFGTMFKAKQMMKLMYGILERQFHGYYEEASKRKGSTGEILLSLLEARLDNIVYRMGFGSTRAEARQLVRHKSIVVKKSGDEDNTARVVNIPSYRVKPGDVIEIREKSKSQVRIKDALRIAENLGFVDWVEVDPSKLIGVLKRYPDRKDLPTELNEQMVVELYSK